jgi:hypothetical protein
VSIFGKISNDQCGEELWDDTKQTRERQRKELYRRTKENGEGSEEPYSWKH